MSEAPKRGLTYAEAMAYVGVKRRTFEERWRPRLVVLRQGITLIFDRADLDRLFDEFKAEAAAANDDAGERQAQNGPRNGRPSQQKGEQQWANNRAESTPARTEDGRSTSGGAALDFASAASRVLEKRKRG